MRAKGPGNERLGSAPLAEVSGNESQTDKKKQRPAAKAAAPSEPKAQKSKGKQNGAGTRQPARSKPAVSASAPSTAGLTAAATVALTADQPSTVAAPSATKRPIEREDIARRAWEIWQGEGCPDGRELEHWLRAERELSGA